MCGLRERVLHRNIFAKVPNAANAIKRGVRSKEATIESQTNRETKRLLYLCTAIGTHRMQRAGANIPAHTKCTRSTPRIAQRIER